MTSLTNLRQPLSLAFILLVLGGPNVYADLEVFASFEKSDEIAAVKASPGVRIAASRRFPAWAGNSLEAIFPIASCALSPIFSASPRRGPIARRFSSATSSGCS